MKELIFALLIATFSIHSVDAQWWTGNQTVDGNGNMTSESRNVSTYDLVALEGNMDIELIAGREGRLTIEAESNLIEHIRTEVSGGQLKVSIEKGISLNPSRNHGIKIIVPFESLNGLSLTGSGDIYNRDRITANDFALKLTGSGDLRIDLDAQNVTAKLTGSGDIALQGKAREFKCTVTGSGDFNAYDFQVRSAEASVLGSGDIKLNVSEELRARVAGSGDIRYRGNPEKEDFRSTGSGSVSKN